MSECEVVRDSVLSRLRCRTHSRIANACPEALRAAEKRAEDAEEKLRDAEARNMRSVCTYCGTIQEAANDEERLEKMVDHMMVCEKSPVLRAVSVLGELDETKSALAASQARVRSLREAAVNAKERLEGMFQRGGATIPLIAISGVIDTLEAALADSPAQAQVAQEPEAPAGCVINEVLSRVCSRGTKSCEVFNHGTDE